MAQDSSTSVRLMIAGGLLSAALAVVLGAATFGDLRVGAGEMDIHLGQGQQGLLIKVSSRSCTPTCGIDLMWKPVNRRAFRMSAGDDTRA